MADTFQVRDNRNGFLWVNNEIVDEFASKIGPTAFLVYAVLARHAHFGSEVAFPSQKKIAFLSGISERAVRTALCILRDNGLIRWEQRQGTDKKYHHNVYVLTQPDIKPAADSADGSENHRNETAGSQLPTNKTKKNKTKTQDEDFLNAVEEIRKIHPRSDAPAADRRAIKAAASNMVKEGKVSTLMAACRVLYVSARAYRNERADQDPHYTKTCAAWFNGECFERYARRPKQEQLAIRPSLPDGLAEMRARRNEIHA